MEITLYLEDRELILTDKLQDTPNTYHYDFTVIPLLVSKIKKQDLKKVYLYHPKPQEALSDIKKYFDVIEAAGGIVLNEKNEVLFIYRRGVWDLPKGKMEPDENPAETAVREVQEECGLQKVEPTGFLADTYHIFKESGRRKLKITHWYLMKASSDARITPQAIEGIEKVAWMSSGKLKSHKDDKIYLSIKHLLERLDFFD
jgi:8-oxo-dGTP pyrophosphatase MutT (NUDIX family)